MIRFRFLWDTQNVVDWKLDCDDAELADGRNQVDVNIDPRQAGFF